MRSKFQGTRSIRALHAEKDPRYAIRIPKSEFVRRKGGRFAYSAIRISSWACYNFVAIHCSACRQNHICLKVPACERVACNLTFFACERDALHAARLSVSLRRGQSSQCNSRLFCEESSTFFLDLWRRANDRQCLACQGRGQRSYRSSTASAVPAFEFARA